jgi:ArsR family transcriptional regulator
MTEIEKEDICQCNIIHNDKICQVCKGISSDEALTNTAELFKVLSDPTRLKIINALILSEMCVCDLTELLQMTQPVISYHLKTLRQLHLVKTRRNGKTVFYSLDDEHVHNVFYQGLMHAQEEK